MTYIRHDINNNPVSPQPGVSTVSDLGGISGWSTVTYQNYNSDFIARTYNGLSVREVNSFTARNIDNTAREPEDYLRRDDTNFPKPKLDLRFALNKSLTDHISGNNLITFSRASSGTFVGSDGLIKTTPVNLAKNSEDFSTGRNNASFGVKPTVNTNQIAAPNGTTTADEIVTVATAQQNRLANPHSVTSGKNYTYSVFVKYNNTDTVQFYLGYANKMNGIGTFVFSTETATISGGTGLSAGFDKLSNGWYRFYFTASAFTTGSTNSGFLGGTDADKKVYVWGEQIEEGSSPSEYIPTGATISGPPRFDHDPETGESLGLLIEESRTNTISNSDNPSGTVIQGTFTRSLESVVSPRGIAEDVRKVEVSGGGAVLRFGPGASNGAVNTTYSVSFWIKSVDGGTGSINIDINDRNITEVQYTGEWTRITRSGGNRSDVGHQFFDLSQRSSTTDFYIFGAQMEIGSFATSYIPTSGSSVTRAADVAEITGTNFASFYNQSEGTVFVETSTPLETNTIDVQISDGTNNTKYELRSAGVSLTEAKPSIRVTGVTRFATAATAGSGSFRKLALGYKRAKNAFACDGNISTSTSNFNLPSGVNKLRIGDEYVNTNRSIGHIKRFAYMPYRLPNTIIQSMTS